MGKFESVFFEKFTKIGMLLWIPLFVLTIAILISIWFFIAIGIEKGLFNEQICYSYSCIRKFIIGYMPVYSFMSDILKFIAGLIAILVAFTAVKTYQLSVKNNVLSNHIAHFDMFKSYLNEELDKLPRIDKRSIDVFRFFVFIFPASAKGDFIPSDQYVQFINKINQIIKNLENKYSSEKSAVFNPFKDHQSELKEVLMQCGLDIALKPNQTDFFRVEFDVYELLRKVNECFCSAREIPLISYPKYS